MARKAKRQGSKTSSGKDSFTIRKSETELRKAQTALRKMTDERNGLAQEIGPIRKKKETLAEENRTFSIAVVERNSQITELKGSVDYLLDQTVAKEIELLGSRKMESILRRQARFQSYELQQLKRLLTGALYLIWLAPLIRRWRKWWAPKKKRDSKRWRAVCLERSHRIGSWRCERCGKTLTVETAIGHHIIEFSEGGTDTVENCQLTCEDCERSWHNGNGKNSHNHHS
ncbi:MAG: HNH endonuclease [bacterium]